MIANNIYFASCVYLEQLLKLLWHILPALITVILGAFVLQKYFVRKANASIFVDSILKELEGLRKDTLNYWNEDDGADHKKFDILAQSIKGAIKVIGSDISHFCDKYEEDKALKDQFNNLLVKLSDAATGGDFESPNRKRESGRYLVIVNAINDLKSELLQTKL